MNRFLCKVPPTLFFVGTTAPQRARASSFTGFLDHTQRRTTFGRTPLDEWSARRRDLYLTTHNIHNRQTSNSPVGLEPTISAAERPQTYALDRAATGIVKASFTLDTFYWNLNLRAGQGVLGTREISVIHREINHDLIIFVFVLHDLFSVQISVLSL